MIEHHIPVCALLKYSYVLGSIKILLRFGPPDEVFNKSKSLSLLLCALIKNLHHKLLQQVKNCIVVYNVGDAKMCRKSLESDSHFEFL